jgi:hypothetical protein
LAILDAHGVGRVARIIGKQWHLRGRLIKRQRSAHARTEAPELAIIASSNQNVTVSSSERLVWHD